MVKHATILRRLVIAHFATVNTVQFHGQRVQALARGEEFRVLALELLGPLGSVRANLRITISLATGKIV